MLETCLYLPVLLLVLMMSAVQFLIWFLIKNITHYRTHGSGALSAGSGSATAACDTRMNQSDLRMHPARSLSASLSALTTKHILRSIGYYRIPAGIDTP